MFSPFWNVPEETVLFQHSTTYGRSKISCVIINGMYWNLKTNCSLYCFLLGNNMDEKKRSFHCPLFWSFLVQVVIWATLLKLFHIFEHILIFVTGSANTTESRLDIEWTTGSNKFQKIMSITLYSSHPFAYKLWNFKDTVVLRFSSLNVIEYCAGFLTFTYPGSEVCQCEIHPHIYW